MNSIIARPCSLQITNLQNAHEKYDSVVEIHRPMLTISEFKEQQNLPLNDQCCSVFYEKTSHLKDTDFVEIDRPMLELIGFKNLFMEKKDRNGNVKNDASNMPKMIDKRTDFNNAIKCLRNTAGFIEGTSTDDPNAHFVIEKLVHLGKCTSRYGGHNKQTLWIRMRALEHFVIMANTSNSFMIREFFVDLKRIMIEFNMYQTVYNAKVELCIKDTAIGHLNEKLDHVIEQNGTLMKQNEIQSQKLDVLSQLLYKETDDKVMDLCTKQKKQELVVLCDKTNPNSCEVLRGQVVYLKNQLKRKQNEMEVVGKINTYKNPINLYNRFGEHIKKEGDDRFKKTNNKILLKDGCTADDLMNAFHTLDENKHDVALKVKELL